MVLWLIWIIYRIVWSIGFNSWPPIISNRGFQGSCNAENIQGNGHIIHDALMDIDVRGYFDFFEASFTSSISYPLNGDDHLAPGLPLAEIAKRLRDLRQGTM
jgi:hypothetical protein